MSVDQALSLLWQAARPSPHLREAVELVEAEVRQLRERLEEAQLRSIEARNPGIDMDEVRASRSAHIDGNECG